MNIREILRTDISKLNYIIDKSRYQKLILAVFGVWMIAPFLGMFVFFLDWIKYGCIRYSTLADEEAVRSGYIGHSSYDYKTLLNWIAFFTVLVFIIYILLYHIRLKEISAFIRSKVWYVLFVFGLFWASVSTLFSEEAIFQIFGGGYEYEGLLDYYLYVILFFCGLLITDTGYKKRIVELFIIIADVCGLLSLGQIWHLPVIRDAFYSTSTAIFYNSNHFGYYLTMSVMCCAGLYLFEDKKKNRIWLICSYIFLVYVLLLNNTFGCYLAVAFSLPAIYVLYYYHSHDKNTKISKSQLLPILCFIILSVLHFLGVLPGGGIFWSDNFSQTGFDIAALLKGTDDAMAGGSGRIILWVEALKIIMAHPILGVGAEGLTVDYYHRLGLFRPHNEFIQYAVFFGIPGLFCYVGVLVTIFLHQCKRLKNLSPITVVAAGAVIAYLASSFFGNTKYYTTPYFFILLAFAASDEWFEVR